MSTITDCTPADPVAVSSTSPSRLYEKLQIAAIGIDSILLGRFITLSDGGEAAVSSSAFDLRASLSGASIAVVSTALQQGQHLLDLFGVRIAVAAAPVSRLTTLTASAAITQVPTTIQTFTPAVVGVSVAVESSSLQQQHITALAKVSIGVASSIVSHRITLASVSVAVSSLALQVQKITDLIIAPAIGVGVEILDARSRFDLGSVGIAVSVLPLTLVHAIDLLDADVCVGSSALDNTGAQTGIWTANTDSFAMSRYTVSDTLLSVATGVDGTFFGGDNVIYHRAGVEDSWEVDINALVETGLLSFGQEFLERADKIVLRYRSNGAVAVDVGVTGSGNEITYTYTSEAFSMSAIKPVRIEMGRGAVSGEWRFKVRNLEGEPLSLRGFLVDLLSTTRRM